MVYDEKGSFVRIKKLTSVCVRACVHGCVCKTLGFRKRSFNPLIKCIEKHINMSNRTHNELQRHIPNQVFTVQLQRDQDSF